MHERLDARPVRHAGRPGLRKILASPGCEADHAQRVDARVHARRRRRRRRGRRRRSRASVNVVGERAGRQPGGRRTGRSRRCDEYAAHAGARRAGRRPHLRCAPWTWGSPGSGPPSPRHRAGWGWASAKALAAEGVDGRHLRPRPGPHRRRRGGRSATACIALVCDVGERRRAATAFVAAATEALGGIDILVTNAGGPPPGNFASTDVDAYPAAIDLNLLSVVAMCKAAVPADAGAGVGPRRGDHVASPCASRSPT